MLRTAENFAKRRQSFKIIKMQRDAFKMFKIFEFLNRSGELQSKPAYKFGTIRLSKNA